MFAPITENSMTAQHMTQKIHAPNDVDHDGKSETANHNGMVSIWTSSSCSNSRSTVIRVTT